MDDIKLSVISSILNFLRGELHAGNLDSGDCEALEVAILCLENIYDVSNVRWANEPSLVEIYKYYYENSIFNKRDATEEEKAEGERFKVEGNTLMSVGKYLDALQLYTKAIECDPKNAVYYSNRAAAKNKLKDHAAAIRDCKIALQLNPIYSKAYGRLGLAYTGLESYVYALENYKKAYDLEPDNVGYRRNLEIAQQKVSERCSLNINPHTQLESNIPSTSGPNLGATLGHHGNDSGDPAARMPQLPADLNILLGNPQLVNIASQMLADPTIQNIGQSLARHIQVENPNLFDQLRDSFDRNDPGCSNAPSSSNAGNKPDSDASSSHDENSK